MARKIGLESEQIWMGRGDQFDRRKALALFSAKEAAFKAFYPLEEVFLGFQDVKFEVQKKWFQRDFGQSCWGKMAEWFFL